MGIDLYTLERIKGVAESYRFTGPALALGRQKVNRQLERDKALDFARTLPGCADIERPARSEFVERVFRALGFRALDALDISDYQGANVIFDLSDPELPDHLVGRYDLIYDGGSTEHIFDLPNAFWNIHRLLKVGGVFVSANMLNGDPGHGLFQFGPDLVWSYWKRGLGYEVLSCAAQPIVEKDGIPPFEIPDAGAEGRRFHIGRRLPKSATYLHYIVRKTADTETRPKTFQGDYEVKWSEESIADRPAQVQKT